MSNDEDMSVVKEPVKKKSRSIDEEISAVEAKLHALRQRKNQMAKRKREQNSKAVLELFQAEGLLDVSIDSWKGKLPEIKGILGLV